MKLPKELSILGNKWKIVEDKESNGGSFKSSDREMIIGMQYPNYQWCILMHEVLEVILVNRGKRYDRYDVDTNDGRMFVMSHAEFCNVADDLAATMEDLWKKTK